MSADQENILPEELLKSLEEQKIDEKIKTLIAFMRGALNSEKKIAFDQFWEAKKLCLEVFKSKELEPHARTILWKEYTAVLDQATEIKKMLEQKGLFELEQIELAVSKVERDFVHFEEQITAIAPPRLSQDLREAKAFSRLIREIKLLDLMGKQTQTLRNELIAIDLRMGLKSSMLNRIKKNGDKIYALRREKTSAAIALFESEIERFKEHHFRSHQFVGESCKKARFVVRDLQQLAKDLLLPHKIFAKMREELSRCWSAICEVDEKRREASEKREKEESERAAPIMEKIQLIEELCAKEDAKERDIEKEEKEVVRLIKESALSRDKQRSLFDLVKRAKMPFIKRREAAFEEIAKKEEASRIALEKATQDLVEELRKMQEKKQVAAFKKKKEELREQIKALELSSSLEDEIATLMLGLVHLELCDAEKKAKDEEALEELYDQRIDHREEVKAQFDKYKKMIAGSGFDFEMAIHYNNLHEMEKQRLGEIDLALDAIEAKLG